MLVRWVQRVLAHLILLEVEGHLDSRMANIARVVARCLGEALTLEDVVLGVGVLAVVLDHELTAGQLFEQGLGALELQALVVGHHEPFTLSGRVVNFGLSDLWGWVPIPCC